MDLRNHSSPCYGFFMSSTMTYDYRCAIFIISILINYSFYLFFFHIFGNNFQTANIVDIESSNTSPSYSPSLPDMANTQNFEVENMLNINNNNKIIAKSRSLHSNILPTVNGNRNEDAIDELKSPESIAKESQRSAEEIGVAYTTPTMNTSNRISATEQRSIQHLRTKGEGSRAAKYGKVNGASLSQLPSNTNNNNNNTSNNNNNNNVEGSYHCQFCDKSFPRLGYLKKHEQVSA